jgi:hypothetical protein
MEAKDGATAETTIDRDAKARCGDISIGDITEIEAEGNRTRGKLDTDIHDGDCDM